VVVECTATTKAVGKREREERWCGGDWHIAPLKREERERRD